MNILAAFLVSLFSLLALGGCSTVDLNQAELCEEVARILFAGNRIDRLVTATDERAAHAFITAVSLSKAGGTAQRRVSCGFQSSGPKSEDQMELAVVSSDVDGRL